MLSSYSTLLGRAQRAHRLLVRVEFTHIDIAFAAIQAAERAEHPLILALDARRIAGTPPEVVLRATLEAARFSHQSVTVEVMTNGLVDQVNLWLATGALAVAPQQEQLTDAEYAELLKKAALHAAVYNAGVIASPIGPHSAEEIEQLVHATGINAVHLPFPSQPLAFTTQAKELASLHRRLKVPLITGVTSLPPSQFKKLPKLGIVALSLETSLDEAYTAGLRTALRDRGLADPTVYSAKAQLAVEQYLLSLFSDHI